VSCITHRAASPAVRGFALARSLLPPAAYPAARPRRLRRDAFTRALVREHSLSASDLILPISLAVEHRLTVDQLARAFSVYPSLSASVTDAARAMHIVG